MSTALDRIAYNNDVLVTALGYVPEPTTAMLQFVSVITLGLLARRRRVPP